MSGDQLLWNLSGAHSDFSTVTTPLKSRGAWSADALIYAQEGTLTAVTTSADRHIIDTDLASGGRPDDIDDRGVLVMATGTPAQTPFATRILNSFGVSGKMLLESPLPADGAIGDTFRICYSGNVFGNVTAEESRLGVTDYRCIAFRSAQPAAITIPRFYIIPLDTGGCRLDVLPQFQNTNFIGTDPMELYGENDGLPPEPHKSPLHQWGRVDGAELGGWSDANWTESPTFVRPPNVTFAVPVTGSTSISQNTTRPILLRRIVPSGRAARQRCHFLLVLTSPLTGQDPDPFFSVIPIVFDIEGTPLTITVSFDRFAFIGCGSFVIATVTDTGTGSPVEGVFVDFELTVGPGTLAVNNAFTNKNGEAIAVYNSPTSDTFEGDPVTVVAKLGGGEE